jgi:hypothetical protein
LARGTCRRSACWSNANPLLRPGEVEGWKGPHVCTRSPLSPWSGQRLSDDEFACGPPRPSSSKKSQALDGMTKGRAALWFGFAARGDNSRSLHFATPDFLWSLVASVSFMRLSARKGAHAVLSSAAWQEIRVRSGRDDNSFVIPTFPVKDLGVWSG